ncbi:MAG: IS5 family transposase [Mediterranea sp.]|nr:IS5 family transposase [Mediterranea sp.]
MVQKRKSRAFNPRYESPNQGTLFGFEHPFERELDMSNRWVVLSKLIPWDELCNIYYRQVGKFTTGRDPLNPRIILGALIIKYLCHLDDREAVAQMSENIYMQYFLGYPSFINEQPFDASLYVTIRKKLGMETINLINERIIQLRAKFESENNDPPSPPTTGTAPLADANGGDVSGEVQASSDVDTSGAEVQEAIVHKGSVIFDATACPQDIAFPTDLDLLSDAREKSEELIDKLYTEALHGVKPRTYRKIARKEYLKTAQKRKKTKEEVRLAIGKQLRYLSRNLRTIDKLLDSYAVIPLSRKDLKYYYVIQTLYAQQQEMYRTRTHRIDDRIVSIHQPHVRPIVRGKAKAEVEFGSKIHLSLIDGYSFLDELSWDAFNEGSHMEQYVESYRRRFGFYPKQVLADKIYCTRENRKMLKDKGIKLVAKPLGRPSAVPIHVSPGERNPIEGKFGQAKTAYGLDRIRARLKDTSESWIAGIILVLNLVKLAGAEALCTIRSMCNYLLFGYWVVAMEVSFYHHGHTQIKKWTKS